MKRKQRGIIAPVIIFIMALVILVGTTVVKTRQEETESSTKEKTETPPKTTTPSPSPSPSPASTQASGSCTPAARSTFVVKPYLVYPADKPMYAEYESSVRSYLYELQKWYCDKVGVTFPMQSLQVVRSSYNYQTVRCGENPSQECLNNQAKLDGNIGFYANKAIHGGIEKWEEQTAALIFFAGAGGYAGANKYANDAGWAIAGDWVLEPISGTANSWGIPCSYSDGWQCSGGVPKGTPAHELGHAFGLEHSGGPSIMDWHGGYPTVGFLQSEIGYLHNSPFFK